MPWSGETVDCPDDDTLVAMIEHALDPATFQALEVHLDSCGRCRTVAAMALGSQSVTHATPAPGPAGLDRDPEGLVGSKIHDRYQIMSVLGRGGMGTVYLARDVSLDRDVALKVHRFGSDNARLQREAVAMAQLAHPNVVNVFEVGVVDTWIYVAMEYVRGVTLRDWIAAPGRGWRDVVALLVATGHGLAAAHGVGLVHRDFKPENVLVGDDGRPRVSDFGLARVDQAIAEAASSSASLAVGITITGSVLGTPAYMAPEQFAAASVVDARCDQFAFCVVAWECLYGARPFAGATMAAVQLAIEDHQLPRPARSAVPDRVRRVIARGLAVAPADRYPDLTALLADLRRAAAPRIKRRIAIATAIAVAVVGAAIPIGSELAERRRIGACLDEADAVRTGFDPATRSTISQRFLATGSPFARGSFAAMAGVIERHTEALAAQTSAVCRGRGEPTRRACLVAHERELSGLIETLAQADASLVQRAPDAAWAIYDPSPCDEDHLALPMSGSSPVHVATLGRVKALAHAGRYQDGVALATPLLDAAHGDGDRGLELATLLALGQLRNEIDPPEQVAPVFHQAQALAETLARDLDAAAALAALANVAGVGQHDYPAAHRYIALARAKLARLGGANLLLEANLDATEAQTLVDENRIVEAEPIQRRALATLERIYGVEHPSVGAASGTLSQILQAQGKRTEALAASQRTLQILERALGPDHPTVAGAEMTLAQSLIDVGQLDEARERMARADQVFVRVFGPDHPVRAAIHGNLGQLEQVQGRWDAALAAYRTALGILERTEGPGSPGAAGARRDIALALASAGRLDEAAEEAERSVSIMAELGPDGGPRLAGALVDLATIQLARARPALAATAAGRALDLVTSKGDRANPDEVSAARFALARALWDSRDDLPRARKLAQQALTGAPDPATRAEIETWLAGHPIAHAMTRD